MEKILVVGRHMWARKLWVCLGVLLAFAIGYLIRYSFYGSDIPKANGAVSNTKARLILMEDKLQFAALETKQSPEKTTIISQVEKMAKERKNELVEMMQSNPAEARKLLLSPESSKALRDKGLTDVEEHVTISGRYGFRQFEDEDGDHFVQQIVLPDGKTYSVNTEQMLPKITHGSVVKTSGFVIGDQLLVDATPGAEVSYAYNAEDNVTTATSSDPAPIATVTTAQQITSVGQQNVLVLMGNFTGSSLKVDTNKVKAYYNNLPGYDVASYVAEVSSGIASFSPVFFGSYDYANVSCSDTTAQTGALKGSVAGQTDLSSYSVIVYVTNCNKGSAASWGGSGPRVNYIGLSGDANNDRTTMIHEYAHTLGSGLRHGGYLSCGAEIFIPPTNNIFEENGCQVAEYDDPYDVLGELMDGYSGHLSVSHKLEAGWLDSSRVPTLSSTGTFTYMITPLEQSSGVVGLKIPRGGGKAGYFTVEYRQPIGRDSYITSPNSCYRCTAHTGATVRLSGMTFSGPGGGADSNMLDSTPGSLANTRSYWPNTDGRDGAFTPGKSFTDPEYGISITTLSADTSGVKVEVKIANASCVNNTPRVSAVSPAVQTALPGQSKTYTMTVTNTDTSGCAPQTFRYVPYDGALAYASQVAQGQMNILMSPDYFTLSPGETRQVTLTVTSTEDTPDGDYFSSAPALGYVYSKSFGVPAAMIQPFAYQVASPIDTIAPSAPSELTATPLGSSAVRFDWKAAQDDKRVIRYEVKLSNGAVLYTTLTSLVVQALTPSAAYTVSVRALDAKMNYSSPVEAQFTMKAVSDVTPPKASRQVNVTATDHSASLLWSPVSDNQTLACYLMTVSGYSQSCSITGALTSYSFSGLPSRYRSSHTIAAFDGDGNVALGQPRTYYTAVEGDVSAPTAPDKLYIATQTYAGGTQLRWQGSSDNKNIVGYNIFRGCCKRGFATTNSLTLPSTGFGSMRLQAVDSDGSLSPETNDMWLPEGPSVATSDTIAPIASLKAPTNNATTSGSVILESITSDNVGVTSVSYYMDGMYLGASTVAPNFPLQLNTENYINGKHWFVAFARDAAGNGGSAGPSDVVFTNGGDATPPSISISAPMNGTTVQGRVTVSAEASDEISVSQVSFQVDGRVIATDKSSPYSASWDSSKVSNGSHTITVTATDMAGNSSATSVVVTVTGSDINSPTAPANLSVNIVDATRTQMTWEAATDDTGVIGYYVVRNGVTIAQLQERSYSDTGLSPTNAYQYYIIAYDAAGNVSAQSNAVIVTMPGTTDTTPPSVPTGLVATTVSASQINLSWTSSSDNVIVSGYEVYRDNQRIATVNTTSFGDTGLAAGSSHSYFVRAKDSAGNSSANSSSVTATTQNSTPTSTKATLQGVITSQTGGSLANVTISVTMNRSTITYTSGSDGSYRVADLNPGTYTVKYAAKGFKTYSYSATLLAGQTISKNITLIKTGK
jgi:chitodextrinase